MHKEESRTDLGNIKIHNNVIASIASLAALEIEGTKRIGKNLKSSFMDMSGQKGYYAIRVEIDKNEEVKIDMPLIIKYGFNIPEVASRVQENVRASLEKMTNLNIKDINITVKGIESG